MNFAKTSGAARLLLIGAVLLLMASCARNDPGVWARVDGTPIYRSQVDAIYHARQSGVPSAAKPAQALAFKLAILNDLIDRALLLKRAADLHIQVSGEEVDARLAQLQSPSAARTANDLPLPALRKQAQESLEIQSLIQKEILSQITVTPAEIASYYDHNPSEFEVPEDEVHLAEIVVNPSGGPVVPNLKRDNARDEREAERKIEALYLQVRTGKDFAKVAAEFSEDPRTASSGGDMGFLPVSRFAPDRTLSRALKTLKPGQITGIIRDRAGFHIYKLLGRVRAGRRQLSDPAVEQSIRKTLSVEKSELLKAAYIESLRNHARVADYLAQEILQDHGEGASAE